MRTLRTPSQAHHQVCYVSVSVMRVHKQHTRLHLCCLWACACACVCGSVCVCVYVHIAHLCVLQMQHRGSPVSLSALLQYSCRRRLSFNSRRHVPLPPPVCFLTCVRPHAPMSSFSLLCLLHLCVCVCKCVCVHMSVV